MRRDAAEIFREALFEMLPDRAVKRSLSRVRLKDEIILIGIGKASWIMAKAASEELKERIVSGAIVTKYGHSQGPLPGIEIYEAGHPLPDSNTLKATERILEITRKAGEAQTILFLVSGGGSALFEKPAEVIAGGYFTTEINMENLASGVYVVNLVTEQDKISGKVGKY